MPLKIASIAVLAIALTVPLAANAVSGEHAWHHVPHHHRTVATRAQEPRAAILAAARPAFGDNETDGLSRNPDDCVTYGCIDNGN